MDLGLEALTSASADGRDIYRPDLFRLALPADAARLRELLNRSPGIQVFDELRSQFTELVRSLNPSIRYTKEELDSAAQAHLGNTPSDEYGVWVFYPWSARLVHLLDEDEFALVRTDRNRNKITREEQAVLSTKKVGVIGLSVGQSVSLAMAMERSFGELRLADFDTLDLSNLNRIRSGVHQLGVNKAVNTAREIAEIDPYLRVTCFSAGITEANIDRFMTEGGKLDLLVEECDSVAIKIIARKKAKHLCIPVVMDTSDRGLIDVERFDIEPERPIMHGLVDHLDPDMPHPWSAERARELAMTIVQPEQLSQRMRASLTEIGKTLTTWPQLATAVFMGGSVAAEAGRRILLGQSQASGRWYIDTEALMVGPLAIDIPRHTLDQNS